MTRIILSDRVKTLKQMLATWRLCATYRKEPVMSLEEATQTRYLDAVELAAKHVKGVRTLRKRDKTAEQYGGNPCDLAIFDTVHEGAVLARAVHRFQGSMFLQVTHYVDAEALVAALPKAIDR